MRSLKIFVIVALVLTCLAPATSFAQGDPGCDPLDPLCPIDGGLSLLIAAGIGLGAKRAYDAKKKENTTDM